MVASLQRIRKAEVRFGLSGRIVAIGLIAIGLIAVMDAVLGAPASARDRNAGVADFFSDGTPRPPRSIPRQKSEHAVSVRPKSANAPMHQAETVVPQSARETPTRPSATTFPPVTPLE
jgi:hypothetical protein